MTRCSNCGTAIEGGSAVCQSCGTAVQQATDSNHGRQTSGGHGQQQAQSGGGQPQHGADGQPNQPGQHGTHGQRGRPADDGVSRRQLLKYGGGGVLGLGGLWLLFGGGGPADAVKRYFNALNRGDTEAAERLAHDDGSADPDGILADLYADAPLSVDNTLVKANDGQEAVVETVLTVGSMGSAERSSSTIDVELRTEGGRWKIWSTTAV